LKDATLPIGVSSRGMATIRDKVGHLEILPNVINSLSG
jgi:hypothetical protein